MSTSTEKAPPPPKPTRKPRGRRWPVITAALVSFAYLLSTAPRDYALCSESYDIYTVDETQPRVQCIVVAGSRILDRGDLTDVRQRWAARTQPTLSKRVLSLVQGGLKVAQVKPGSIVVPGLADAHAHVLEYGFKMQLQLDGSKSIDEVISRLKTFLEKHPDVRDDSSRWIEGMGWDQTKWAGAQFPTAEDFDREPLLRGRPIALVRVDGHATWVSSRVLELMGDLPQEVDGGVVIRDGKGKPTGIMVDNAMDLIPNPPRSEAVMHEYFDLTMKHGLAHGLTSIHDAMATPEMISFFKKCVFLFRAVSKTLILSKPRLSAVGKLPMRLYLMGNLQSEEYWGSKIEKLHNHGQHGRLNVRSVKLFTDAGALGSWGAALIAPYTDKSETNGIMRSTPEALAALVKQFWDDGWQVNIHCIGDRANKIVLDIFEDLLGTTSAIERRPRIEHAQIMQPSDLERAGRLGVITSVQPTHATSDMGYAESRLGPERLKTAYAYQSQLQ
ncbi:hypothetical protein HWV62_19371 [Athelia sp. TMB]|nr:hypothetical protein HWV62_19371 [Athelia sp. TMB]